MNDIIAYFSTISSAHRSLILVGGITVFWLIENTFPLFRMKYQKWQHAGINFFLTFTTIVVNFVLAFILIKTANWTTINHFGILNWLPQIPIWLYTIIGLLLLDFIGAYLAHFVQHKIKFLWRFHIIHHTDTWIDTTTANRHHPGESIIRFIFTTLGVLIVGSPMWMVFLYQSLSVIFSQFNHANISLPGKVDVFLSYFIISPNMHKVHHHYVLPYTDSNYGNIFSVWDRLFSTFTTLPKEEIIYGVDTHMAPEENNKLKNLLQIPFQKSRSAKNS
ncbi:sterol desaturase [Flavobacterium aquidurense]|jgi:sterol desaturase/sphingolipid hydroxylase (fatty acid hydroxylase superfamily)|uniref:sterol desaturase family protein n=1 Tax=Flavobacterium aquidurense TaxID=362413 RepID=UPI000917FD43|nr:sterol desaturase family protein [Flavobacterium aquidurense]OXA72711.1 sterol desaturase [Flavobacterium aquidurense]SHG27868.1 Sterol desaturase/sphingolipid hydroxylase, fatty acid hydroxylase superfamily [Flavobacterium frigidimaris]